MSEPTEPRPEPRPGLAAGAGGLDRMVREDLDKMLSESLLARQDAAAELTRDIEEAVRAPLALAEISEVVNRLEGPVLPSFNELKDLLVSPEARGLEIEKNLLTDLLREGTEGSTILKKGLTFLKHRKYAEAVEWWSLNRGGVDPATSQLHLLLLIMECLTWHWSGNLARAAAVREQVRASPLYRRGQAVR
jgi:hypothetical protein